MEVSEQLRRLVDLAAEQVVMADASDKQELAALSLHLANIHRILAGQGDTRAGHAQKAVAEMERVLSGRSADVLRSVGYVSGVIGALQSILCAGKAAEFPVAPEVVEVQSAGEDVKPAKAGAAAAFSTGSVPIAPAATSRIADAEMTRDFVTEAQEHFDYADAALLELEKNPKDANAVRVVFRAFHTIKGMAAYLDMAAIRDTAHDVEALLDKVRNGKASFSSEVAEVTFAGLDILKLLVSRIAAALEGNLTYDLPDTLPQVVARIRAVLCAADTAGEEQEYVAPVAVFDAGPAADGATGGGADTGATSRNVTAAAPAAPSAAAGAGDSARPVMRVDAAKVDQLLDTIGELVIAESIVAQDPDVKGSKSLRLERNLSHLGKITKSLQDLGMAMRMVPVEPAFRRMARLVRDLARHAGKRIEFAMEGQDTEIDKSIVETLADPLMHMVRNAVDHGIESREQDRVAIGKSPVGHIELGAYHRGGNIHIEVRDDGRGLDREAILRKGMELGLVTDQAQMSDSEVFSLIFLPGFSTAERVTDVSGRGVGMDVVKTNVERMHGSMMVKSEPGRGTVFTMVVPLTTAIIDGMLVSVGTETLIVPTLSIIESFRPEEHQVVSVADSNDVVWCRDKLVPLRHVAKLLNLPGAVSDPCKGLVVVVEDAGRSVGLLVDNLLGQQQTVIKSLGAGIGAVPGISGASIMADGRVGLILDVSGLVRIAAETGYAPWQAHVGASRAESMT